MHTRAHDPPGETKLLVQHRHVWVYVGRFCWFSTAIDANLLAQSYLHDNANSLLREDMCVDKELEFKLVFGCRVTVV